MTFTQEIKMNLKKIIIAGTMLAAAGFAFAKTKIVTTIFPEYDCFLLPPKKDYFLLDYKN